MPKTIKNNEAIEIICDPNDQYSHATAGELAEACGFLLPWAVEYAYQHDKTGLKKYMADVYGFGELFSVDGVTIGGDLSYTYPGDPRQDPIMHVKVLETNEEMVVYPYAMVAMREAGKPWFITRMD